jgi:hypothetical protein
MELGCIGLLQVVFIGFKLAGIIDWSWIFVLLPTLLVGGFYGAFIVGFLIVMFNNI